MKEQRNFKQQRRTTNINEKSRKQISDTREP